LSKHTPPAFINVTIFFYNSVGALACAKTISLAPNATQGFWMPTVAYAVGFWSG